MSSLHPSSFVSSPSSRSAATSSGAREGHMQQPPLASSAGQGQQQSLTVLSSMTEDERTTAFERQEQSMRHTLETMRLANEQGARDAQRLWDEHHAFLAANPPHQLRARPFSTAQGGTDSVSPSPSNTSESLQLYDTNAETQHQQVETHDHSSERATAAPAADQSQQLHTSDSHPQAAQPTASTPEQKAQNENENAGATHHSIETIKHHASQSAAQTPQASQQSTPQARPRERLDFAAAAAAEFQRLQQQNAAVQESMLALARARQQTQSSQADAHSTQRSIASSVYHSSAHQQQLMQQQLLAQQQLAQQQQQSFVQQPPLTPSRLPVPLSPFVSDRDTAALFVPRGTTPRSIPPTFSLDPLQAEIARLRSSAISIGSQPPAYPASMLSGVNPYRVTAADPRPELEQLLRLDLEGRLHRPHPSLPLPHPAPASVPYPGPGGGGGGGGGSGGGGGPPGPPSGGGPGSSAAPLNDADQAALLRSLINSFAQGSAQPRPSRSIDFRDAHKVIKLKSKADFMQWRGLYQLFLETHGAWGSISPGPQLLDIMTTNPPDGIYPSGIAACMTRGSNTPAEKEQRDFEFLQCQFAWTALSYGVRDVPEANSVLATVPQPNVQAAFALLHQRFLPISQFTIAADYATLMGIKQQPSETITKYADRMQKITESLNRQNHRMPEVQLVTQFVCGISSLSQSRKDLILQSPDLQTAIQQALQFEQIELLNKRSGTSSSSSSSSHVQAHVATASDQQCYNCGKKGHFARDCRSPPSSDSSNRPPKPKQKGKSATKGNKAKKQSKRCTWCRNLGHTEDECNKKKNGEAKKKGPTANTAAAAKRESESEEKEYPPPSPRRSSGYFACVTGDIRAEIHTAIQSADTVSDTTTFLLDSGASHHMVYQPHHIQNLRPCDPSVKISTAGPEQLRNPQIGDLIVLSTVPSPHHQNKKATATKQLVLSDVMHHPGLQRNLLSVRQLFEHPLVADCVWEKDRAIIFGHDNNPLLIAERCGDLYLVQLRRSADGDYSQAHAATPRSSTSASASVASRSSDMQTQMQLHESLGHLSHDRMAKLIQIGALKVPAGFKLSESPLQCRSCMLGKMVQRSFVKRRPERFDPQRPFDLFVADLHGPVQTESLGGKKYVLVIVDVGSDFSWTIPIAQKSDAEDEIMKLIRALKVEHNRVPTRFHSDRGGEFMSDRLKSFWESMGVQATQTLPYTPQHNGIAERFNRSIVEQARTMMIRAGAPKVLWAEALIAANYIRNRTKIGDDNLVPGQRFQGRSLVFTYAHLHPWGCNAVVKLAPPLITDKYDAVAKETAFVGFEQQLGFRFINAESFPSVSVSRNAIFLNDQFSVMHALRDDLQHTDFAEEEKDQDFFGSLTLRNELKLMKMISLEQRGDQESKENGDDAASSSSSRPPAAKRPRLDPSSVPAAPRRSSRASVPVSRYGLASPGDIGQALVASLVDLEEDLSEFAFPFDKEAKAARASVVIETRAQAMARERARKTAHDAATTNIPLDPNRSDCNSKGELKLPSQRCTADTRLGKQCGARTLNGEFCWNHLRSKMGLRIKQSAIPAAGRGLFAERDFRAGEEVTRYTGDLVEGAEQRFDGSNYVFGLSNRAAIDACRTNTASGRMVNDSGRSSHSPNLDWRVDRVHRTVRLVASQPIRKGEELLVLYGPSYWRLHDARAKKQTQQKEAIAKLARQAAASCIQGREELRARLRGGAARKSASLAESSSSPSSSLASSSSAPLPSSSPLDPTSYSQAMASSHRQQWREAILAEQQSLRRLEVYSIIDKLPPGARLLDTKFVFKMKLDANGKIDRAKVRLVARGFMQREGIDYYETFASVFSYKTFRVLLALAAHHDLEINMWDVETAYLYAPLKENIYIAVPEGFEGPEKGKILKLKKALYGLKQAGREWNHHLIDALISLGYKSCSNSDPSLFCRRSRSNRLIMIATFVDDMPHIFHHADAKEVEADKQALLKKFRVKDLGPAHLVLGMRLTRDRSARTIKLDQEQYLTRILDQFGFSQCRTDVTPEGKGKLTDRLVNTSSDSRSKGAPAVHPQVTTQNYSAAIGSLQYAANSTRPDIAHAVGMAARDTQSPTTESILRVKRIFRYLAGTKLLGLVYSPSSSPALVLTAYTDADWAGDDKDGRSTTGVVLKLANAAVSWLSQKQSIVALSSSEAEYVAASEATREILWLRTLLSDIIQPQPNPTTLFIDNTTAIRMATDESSCGGRRKHINVKHHFLRDTISTKAIQPEWVETAKQQADIMTKPLDRNTFTRLRDFIMGVALMSNENSSSSQ